MHGCILSYPGPLSAARTKFFLSISTNLSCWLAHYYSLLNYCKIFFTTAVNATRFVQILASIKLGIQENNVRGKHSTISILNMYDFYEYCLLCNFVDLPRVRVCYKHIFGKSLTLLIPLHNFFNLLSKQLNFHTLCIIELFFFYLSNLLNPTLHIHLSICI